MEFPVTIESQDDFDNLVKSRLDREKTKQSELQEQLDAATAEKQELETKAAGLETRATTAEQWRQDREAQDQRAELVKKVADEFGIDAKALRGSTEDDLRAHAEDLKSIIPPPSGPVVPGQEKSPDKPAANELSEFVSDFFGGD